MPPADLNLALLLPDSSLKSQFGSPLPTSALLSSLPPPFPDSELSSLLACSLSPSLRLRSADPLPGSLPGSSGCISLSPPAALGAQGNCVVLPSALRWWLGQGQRSSCRAWLGCEASWRGGPSLWPQQASVFTSVCSLSSQPHSGRSMSGPLPSVPEPSPAEGAGGRAGKVWTWGQGCQSTALRNRRDARGLGPASVYPPARGWGV